MQRALFRHGAAWRKSKDSLRLGGTLLGEIGRVGKLHKTLVEQAAFACSKAPDIPACWWKRHLSATP